MSKNIRRRFTGKQKIRLFIAAQGKCLGCGNPLERGWHADHHRPFSKGGKTVTSNGRAKCPKCNLIKCAQMPPDLSGSD